MAKYQIEISRTAEKQLKRVHKSDQAKIINAILQLATNPKPHGFKKLIGVEELYRIRIGNYRVIYSIENKILTIIVLKIGHRKDIYK